MTTKSEGLSGGDILLIGGVGIGAIFLLRSLSRPAAAAVPAPAAASGGGGFLSSLFGALTGAGSSVAGAAQSTVSQPAPLDTSQLPAGWAQSAGQAVSNFFGSILGPTPVSSPTQVSGLGSLGGTVFSHPTLPMSMQATRQYRAPGVRRTTPPGLTGRVPGRGARRYR